LGVPITWDPLYFDNSGLDDEDPYNMIIKSLINKKINHDYVIMHSTPDLWPTFLEKKPQAFGNRVRVGYCTWETNVVPSDWVKCINESVHELWVPSSYNKKNFEDSGVNKTIRVVPHIYLPSIPIERNKVNINDPSVYTFYTIGELNKRKSILDTVEVFCKTFTSNDNVRLVVKTHFKDYSQKNIDLCEAQIRLIVSKYPNSPKVVALLGNLTTKEINAIHTVGDCYVALTKSEGFGLTIFDAFHMKKQIIATGYGGHMDFLGKQHPGLVRYALVPVDGMSGYAGFEDQTKIQEWAMPDLMHASELMRKVYENGKL
jgi:glycosyltransferase involved in cell wall biosynthesis